MKKEEHKSREFNTSPVSFVSHPSFPVRNTEHSDHTASLHPSAQRRRARRLWQAGCAPACHREDSLQGMGVWRAGDPHRLQPISSAVRGKAARPQAEPVLSLLLRVEESTPGNHVGWNEHRP